MLAKEVLKNTHYMPNGYGQMQKMRNGILTRKGAHRHVWEQCFGPIPDGLLVLHKCDNPPCVNPDHLFLGTQEDNIHDAIEKKRVARGEKHGNVRLTEAQARKILAYPKRRIVDFVQEFGVSSGAIAGVRKERTWRHLSCGV